MFPALNRKPKRTFGAQWIRENTEDNISWLPPHLVLLGRFIGRLFSSQYTSDIPTKVTRRPI